MPPIEKEKPKEILTKGAKDPAEDRPTPQPRQVQPGTDMSGAAGAFEQLPSGPGATPPRVVEGRSGEIDPGREAMRSLVDEQPVTRPERSRGRLTPEEMADLIANDAQSPKELEALAAALLRKAGVAGKTKTGNYIAKHNLIVKRDGQRVRFTPGQVVVLSDEQVAHFLAEGAIEPEYA